MSRYPGTSKYPEPDPEPGYFASGTHRVAKPGRHVTFLMQNTHPFHARISTSNPGGFRVFCGLATHHSGGFRVSPEDGTNSLGGYRVWPLLLSGKPRGFRV
jgi:hypothetical protein